MTELPTHLIPVYSVCSIYCEVTSDKHIEELVEKLQTNTLTDVELAELTVKYDEISKPLYDSLNKVCHKIGLNYTECLTTSNENFIKCMEMMFTYLSFNSNIILTNYLNSFINLLELREAMINYLLTGEDSLLPVCRYSVANFVKSYRKPTLIEKLFGGKQ